MSNVETWSPIALNNNVAPPDGFPEGMAPSSVNDSAREVMAAIRRWMTELSSVSIGSTAHPTLDSILIDAAVTTGDIIVPPGTHTLDASTNRTLKTGLRLKLSNGAVIAVPTGRTFTVSGMIDAGPYQIFSLTGTGTVTGLKSAVPEWFGAVGNGTTDDVTALQNCMNSSKVTFLLDNKTYKITTELYPPANHTITSYGPNAVIYRSTTTGGTHVGGLVPYNYVSLKNFTLRGSGAAYVAGADGIVILYNSTGTTWVSPGLVTTRDQTDMAKWRGAYLDIDNVTIENWAANGIEAGPYSKINNVIVRDCLNEGMLIQGDKVQINNPMLLNNTGWGIDLNCSYATVTGGLIYNCGDSAVWPLDMGGIIIASHTQTAGANHNKVVGTTIDTSDGWGVLVYVPTGTDYPLTDTVLSALTIRNVNVSITDANAGGISVVDNSTSGTKLDRVNILAPVINTTTTGHGIVALGGKNINIDDYHIKAAAAKGMYLYNSAAGNWEGINIGKGTIKGCGTDGIVAYGGTKLNIEGYNISDSTAIAAYYGIRLENVTKFNLGQGIIDLDVTNGYGVFLTGTTGHGKVSGANVANCLAGIYDNSTGDYVSKTNNELSDTNTSKIVHGGTHTYSVLSGNTGGDVATPAMPASAVEVSNDYTHPVRVTIVGGTVTVIKKGSVSGGLIVTDAIAGSFVLEPKSHIAIAYTVAPTWLWAGM